MPLAPWITGWRLVTGERLPRAIGRGDPIPLAAFPEGGVVVSDLALGTPGSPVTWKFGNERALVSVTRRFQRSDSIFVFYQVKSTVARRDVRTHITVTNVSNPQLGVRVLQLNFPGQLEAGINVAERVLVVSRESRGRFLIELQVGDQRGGGTSVRMAEYEVK